MHVTNNFEFPQYFFDEIDISKELDLSKKNINKIQTDATSGSPCYMSFYAPAKNIRFVSSYFFQSIKNGLRPFLSDKCKPGEDYFWMSRTGQQWYPWLWSRYLGINSNIESWNHYFEPLERICDIDYEKVDNKIDVSDFHLYLACLDHLFRFNKNFEKITLNKYIKFELPNDTIGVQIRRGELVSQDGDLEKSWTNKNASEYGARPLYHIDEYLESVIKISEIKNSKNIYVSTDSEETLEYIKFKYTNFNIFHSEFDRSKLIRYNGRPNEVALEFDVMKNPNLTEIYTETCFTDLYMLSKCSSYVGGMVWSEYGLLGWLLQITKNKKITPYINIEGQFCMDRGPVKLTLI